MKITCRYRCYPTKKQEQQLNRWLGCGRFVWNKMLAESLQRFEREGKYDLWVDMCNKLPKLKNKEETSFLKEIPAQCLQQKCIDLDKAIRMHWKSKFGAPKFKAKKLDTSGIRFTTTKQKDSKIILSKHISLKIVIDRKLPSKLSSVTIKKNRAGQWFANCLCEIEEPKSIEIKTGIGIDVGLSHFATMSNGEVIDNPKFYRLLEPKIKKIQKSLSRKQKGSKNQEKQRLKLARLHQKVFNQRNNFIHQTCSAITKQYDLVCVEDLNVSGMMKNHCLAKSIQDASWYQFKTMLDWHCKKRGKKFVKVGQWFASTKTCSSCGNIQDMPLSERVYHCQTCHHEMDRDLNASINILQEGKRILQ